MIAAQVKPDFHNEGCIVVPVVTGQIAAQFDEEKNQDLFGVMSVHNELGGNKSVILPLYRLSEISTLVINPLGEKFREESACANTPDWFTKACNLPSQTASSSRAIRNLMKEIVANMGTDTPINRDIQLNILVPEADEVHKKQPAKAIESLQYEILSGEAGADMATYRRVYNATDFYENGHLLEAILSSTLMPAWQVTELDMPYSTCRDVRWLGAQYLSKNTRGNLFPQLMPIIESHLKIKVDKQMMGMNENWGALGFLSSVSKG